VLLRNGRNDEVVPKAALQALTKAAGPAATVRTYEQTHAPSPATFTELLTWLAERLDLDGSLVKGAAAGS